MDDKSLITLEYPKVLERLATYAAFAPSAEKARLLRPTPDLDEAMRRQAETREARAFLAGQRGATIGGARDIRQALDLAKHSGALTPGDLLDVRSTLVAARDLARTFERMALPYPHLAQIAARIPLAPGLIEAIGLAISERGEIVDSASPRLEQIRHDLRVVHDRLLSKMQHMLSDPQVTPFLQESLVTQRDGRYVLPLRAEFKGRLKAIVHDQSASGATLFVEPLGVVELNNQYRELQLGERDEERRILVELSGQVAEHADELAQALEAIAELDLAFARARYAEELGASEPLLKDFAPPKKPAGKTARPSQPGPGTPGPTHPGSLIRLYAARHPLLDPSGVVPIDVELEPPHYVMVITGPNTGGKTVTLKTVGLLALMAQAGLHIPAQAGSEISVFSAIYADIGDEQSIEQSLSTFSGHITNIIRLLGAADASSLVILDELGAGTDPQEGAALARALLTHLLARGITTLVTTHHPELKAFAHVTPGAVNASVEFDLETLSPTYRLTVGLPGRSNALAIAQRLGLPPEIIAAARSEIDPADLQAEDLLDEIHRQRELSRQARLAAESARREMEDLRDQLSLRLERIEDERSRVLEQARAEAAAELERLKTELEGLRREMGRARQPLQALQEVQEQVQALEEALEEPARRRKPARQALEPRRAIRPGDAVRLRTLQTRGVVTAITDEEAELQVGGLRVRTRLVDLELQPEAEGEAESGARPRRAEAGPAPGSSPASPGLELDLRGQRADEALEALERYLDAAYLAGLPFVRLIHGKGTGRLRQAVRQALGRHPHVRSFEPGSEKEGGEGVTVVMLS